MNTYLALDAYTADVIVARHAYRADTAVANGLCGTCKHRKRDQARRLCWTCRHAGVSSR